MTKQIAINTNLLTKDEAFKLIESASKKASSLNTALQRIAVTAIGYANIHGDVTIAQEACAKFSTQKGVRFNSFVAYLEMHGQIKWDKESKNVVYFRRDAAEKDPLALLTTLSQHAWYDAKPEKEPVSIYDCADAVARLIKKLEKMSQEGTVLENRHVLDGLVALANAAPAVIGVGADGEDAE